jgi:hypothetical protein
MAAADAERTDTDGTGTGAGEATETSSGDDDLGRRPGIDASSRPVRGNIDRVADKVKGLLRPDQ